MADALLEVRGLSRRFAAVDALKEVDFSVAADEMHALIGRASCRERVLCVV